MNLCDDSIGCWILTEPRDYKCFLRKRLRLYDIVYHCPCIECILRPKCSDPCLLFKSFVSAVLSEANKISKDPVFLASRAADGVPIL